MLDHAKRQCYFFDNIKKQGCTILETSTCRGCRFYKTVKQYNDDLAYYTDLAEKRKKERGKRT